MGPRLLQGRRAEEAVAEYDLAASDADVHHLPVAIIVAYNGCSGSRTMTEGSYLAGHGRTWTSDLRAVGAANRREEQ